MEYTDGTVARVGDRVRIWNVDTGIIVASMDTGTFLPREPLHQSFVSGYAFALRAQAGQVQLGGSVRMNLNAKLGH